jgi:hypothetical protein
MFGGESGTVTTGSHAGLYRAQLLPLHRACVEIGKSAVRHCSSLWAFEKNRQPRQRGRGGLHKDGEGEQQRSRGVSVMH